MPNDVSPEGEIPHEEERPKKPVGVLSHTDWLTDARDAEAGMELAIATGTNVERFSIAEVGDGRLRLKDGSSIPAQKVNTNRWMVVE